MPFPRPPLHSEFRKSRASRAYVRRRAQPSRVDQEAPGDHAGCAGGSESEANCLRLAGLLSRNHLPAHAVPLLLPVRGLERGAGQSGQ